MVIFQTAVLGKKLLENNSSAWQKVGFPFNSILVDVYFLSNIFEKKLHIFNKIQYDFHSIQLNFNMD